MPKLDYAELCKELKIDLTSQSGDNAIGLCPLHADTSASFSINVETGLWKCFNPSCSGGKGGNYAQLHKLVTGKAWEEPLEVPLTEVEGFHFTLKKTPLMMKWLHEARGIAPDTVDRFKLGWDGDRLTIPIFDEEGKCVNIRRHLCRKARKGGEPKTLSYAPGYGSLKLFPIESLRSSDVLLCEGELDAILACQLGFEAVTGTAGAGSWKEAWTPLFAGKNVDVVYDIDQAGRQGADAICRRLKPVAARLRNVLLPLVNPSNADLTDFVVTFGHSAEDLRSLVETFPEYTPSEGPVQAGTVRPEPIDSDLHQASKAGQVGKLVRMRVMTAGKDISPYACPNVVEFRCDGGLRICKLCSIGNNGGKLTHTVPPLSLEVLKLISCTEEQQRGFIRKSAGIYPGCPRFEMKPVSFHMIEDVRMIPEMSYSSEGTGEYVVRNGFAVGETMRPNSSYEVEGMVVPNPKDQHVTYILDKITQVKDNVEGFQVTEELRESLKVFQPAIGQTVQEKMREIALDLSAHVTRIYEREALIQAVDLVYHSALQFHFQGQLVKKGWTELLVVGDTRCGKTATVTALINHYKAGEFSTGENCSFAGLIGGMQQMGQRWSIIWGKLPLNDRRLLVIDEISGMPVEDIGKMSGVRSSGVAEITKVQSEKTHSRTRLIWIGNPRSPRPLATYDNGVQAVKELIGRPEDVARFDLAIAVASGEVSVETINRNVAGDQVSVQKYGSDLCHALVMWAWSRNAEQTLFTKEAESLCLELAARLSARYSAAIPLIEPAEQRIKLARLSVACAARLFSTDDGDRIVVRPEHVQYVHDFLEELYTTPAMGYLAYSKLKMLETTLQDEAKVVEALEPFGLMLVEGFLERQWIRMGDLEDILGIDKKDVKLLITVLVRQRALKHQSNAYVKSAAFIGLLRKLQAVGMTKVPVGPAGTEF